MNYQLLQGDCLEAMGGLMNVDVVVTDPPYGCGKADWDDAFPVTWYTEARRLAKMIVIITGSAGLRDSVQLVGDDFIDIISARNLNGMTRGPIGFGNWIAALIAKGKPTQGPNAFDFVVTGDMPDHPSPKPLEYMEKLILRTTKEGDTVLDPFMGSGSTGVACGKLGRNFIGIEIDAGYFAIAERRVSEAFRRSAGQSRQGQPHDYADTPLFAEVY